ncbi:MAG: YceI family protein [Deltaproteobacteria bacterium]|nr:YceI family protein [Deltaproteobacteria bacterium]
MRRIAITSVALLILALPALVTAATWEFDPAHTGTHFKVRHLMVSNVRGDFDKVSGKIVYDEKDLSRSSADITIDAASINTRVAQRDAHLKSPDFLDVAKYPTIVFRSKKVDKAGDGKLRMTGDLTIRGVTRGVVLDIEGPTPPIKDMQGNTRVGGTATTTINRKDFGLTWNKALEAGGVVVGDEVEISIDIEIVKGA